VTRTSVELAVLAVVYDVLARVIRAAEFVEDGEVEEAMQVLLDLEHELREQRWARPRHD
jgi:hypothetical protein